ncbi:MAG: OmpH family outer membrane protein [Bacteroidales bacterium]|nr:OmpH family outer membrane protein [Bacteroidales bacterium]
MKKLIVISFILALSFANSIAQKYAFVDTEYILNNIPTYKSAQAQLDKFSADWEKEISDMYSEVERLYKAYQNDAVLLTQEMKKQREDEIVSKEKVAKDLQSKYFGPDGELFKKRQELIKPIQDEVYNAVKELAVEGNYAVIFDSAGSLSMLYTNPRYDLSDDILEKLGYRN